MMTGMVSRYSDESGMGSLVLSDGDIREFTREEWVDKEWEPGMGQQVLYKSDDNGTEVRTISEAEMEVLKKFLVKEETAGEEVSETSKEEPAEEPSPVHAFSTIEEAVEHYTNSGFKTASDREANGIRTISMRFYDNGEYGEAIISANGSTIEIKETRNGLSI